MKESVKVIGTGGIGLCLLPTLCRLLNYGSIEYSFDEVEVSLIDGDEFEERNKDRQDFRNRGNKAEATKNELEDVYPNIFFRSHPLYVNDDNIGVLIKEGDVVFLCVDNHNTRKLVSEYCERELQSVTLISGGNNYHDGSVMVFIRENGKNITLPLHAVKTPPFNDGKTNYPNGKTYHPEIANPDDKHPEQIEKREGCLELVTSSPQLLVANYMAAAHMLAAYHGILTKLFKGGKGGFFQYDDVHFDINSGTAKTFQYSPKYVAKKG